MTKSYIAGAALAALIVVGAGCAPTEQAVSPEQPRDDAAVQAVSPEQPRDDAMVKDIAVPVPNASALAAQLSDTEVTEDAGGEVRTFVVVGNNYSFSLTEIKVKIGDRVRIVFQNVEGFHDWKLDEFNAATKQIEAGQEETIEFTPDMTGTFEYYCSVGRHREMGMKGNLIVE